MVLELSKVSSGDDIFHLQSTIISSQEKNIDLLKKNQSVMKDTISSCEKAIEENIEVAKSNTQDISNVSTSIRDNIEYLDKFLIHMHTKFAEHDKISKKIHKSLDRLEADFTKEERIGILDSIRKRITEFFKWIQSLFQ